MPPPPHALLNRLNFRVAKIDYGGFANCLGLTSLEINFEKEMEKDYDTSQ